MAIEKTIRYTGQDVTVLWKPHLCIHSRKCWHGMPEVFKPDQRPWVLPDAVDAARVIAQVAQCPSGALSIAPPEAGTPVEKEESPQVRVELAPNGPLLVQGTIEVKHADGTTEVKEERCALCRCGASAKKPWCDGSHRKVGFQG